MISVQFRWYRSMRSEQPACAPPHLSAVSPTFTFETAPMFVWLVMALSHPFKEEHQALPHSMPLSSGRSITGVKSLAWWQNMICFNDKIGFPLIENGWNTCSDLWFPLTENDWNTCSDFGFHLIENDWNTWWDLPTPVLQVWRQGVLPGCSWTAQNDLLAGSIAEEKTALQHAPQKDLFRETIVDPQSEWWFVLIDHLDAFRNSK